MDIRQSAIDRTKGFETFVAHLYLDTSGKVTLGFGHLVPSAADMDNIAMSDNGADATAAAKAAAWATVKGKPKGKPASYYAQFTTVRFAQGDAENLLKADLTQAASDLAVRFPALDSYPEAAQDALLDMMFNIGLSNFNKTKWKNLFTAVEAKDWATAATESHRTGLPADRNDAIYQLFVDAGTPKLHLEAAQVFPAMDQLIQRRMDSIMKLAGEARDSGKLFPHGITKIHLSVTAGPVKFELEIDGPPSASS